MIIVGGSASETTGNGSPTRMTRGTRLDLHLRVLLLHTRQTVTVISVPKNPLRFGDVCMNTARTVARFAADVNFRKSRVIGHRVYVEVLFQIRRVALGTHVIPVLAFLRPMK